MKAIKIILFFFCIFLCAEKINCQINIDSLKTVLNKTKPSEKNLRYYLRITEKLAPNESDASLLIADWVVKRSIQQKMPLLTTIALEQIGQTQLELDNYIESSKYLIRALRMAEKHKFYEEEIETLRLLAGVYSTNEQEVKAIEYIEKSLALSKKHNVKKSMGKAYLTLGSLILNLNSKRKLDASEGIKYCKLGITLIVESGDTMNTIRAYEILAQMYMYQGQPDSAMLSLNNAENLIRISNNEETRLGLINNKGNCLNIQKKHKEAIKVFEQGIPLAKKYKSPSWEYLFYYNLSVCYESLKDFKNAHEYASKYIVLHDSMASTENFAIASDIQNKYAREKKENEILRLNKDNEIKKIQLQTSDQKRNQLITFLISALVILLILIVLSALLLKNIQERKKAYLELEQKNEDIKKQSVLLAKQAKQIAQFQSQMNPHFVFNALHNIQGLVISNEDKKATKQIQALAQLMRKTFANAEKEDIAIEEEVSYLNKYIEFEVSALDYPLQFEIKLDPIIENALIPPMMIQPFVENSIKHAQLKGVPDPKIEVAIEAENDLMKITIKDNGVGFNVEQENSDMLSHSVSVIKSRIELLFQMSNKINSTALVTQSKPNEGTTVIFYLPLNESF